VAPLSIPARKKPRLEETPPATTDEAAKKTASPEISVGLPPPTADNDDANADPVTDTHDVLDWSIDRAIGRKNSWTKDEDLKLKNSVQMHSGKDWTAIAAMVPGRTKNQCSKRWPSVLDLSIALTAGHAGKWTEDEDLKLKNSVQMHGGKNWVVIAALVPGRTKSQCSQRWRDFLDPRIDRTIGRTGKWEEEEDIKLKKAIEMHGDKNWGAIAALVPGQTKLSCSQHRPSKWTYE
jgi:hypothetical protein